MQYGDDFTHASAEVREMRNLIDHAARQPYSMVNLYREMDKRGITIHNIGHTIKNYSNETGEALYRDADRHLNSKATQMVNQLPPGEKYIVFAGSAHIQSGGEVKGIAERLGIPNIKIDRSINNEITIAQNAEGFTYSIEYPNKTVGAPERVLSPATVKGVNEDFRRFRRNMPLWGKMALVGTALAAVSAACYFTMHYFRNKQANTHQQGIAEGRVV
jgi:hypothetical protein